MHVLIVKTSSMGDVIHTLPALTDARKAFPDITFDWLIEENFSEIPRWHPAVKKIIPIAWRRWRKNLLSAATRNEFQAFYQNLRAEKYDLIIDAQGLLKSALFSCLARGERLGLDWNSAREKWASVFYKNKFSVVREQHAVTRVRNLFSQALKYNLPQDIADYGIDREKFVAEESANPYLVFLHGTTWATKHWPEESWIELARLVTDAGYVVKLPWGNPAELERAKRIAAVSDKTEVLPRLDLAGMAKVLAGAKAIAAVDTGLGHLAAALDVPTVSLYGPTNPVLTGALGRSQVHLSAQFPCAPCLGKECVYPNAEPTVPQCFPVLTSLMVWQALKAML